MSDKQQQKLDEKEAKRAAKEALKEKQERTKKNKQKKNADRPNIFLRIWAGIKRFFKDFKGTAKKVVWPDRKTVIKSSLVVFAVVLVVGAGIWLVDFGLSSSIGLVKDGIESLNKETTTLSETGETTTAAVTEGNEETTQGATGEDASGGEQTTAGTAETTTAAS
ncbi:MAG: preprotein translocase subunit SecE [Oscillospiraceae bacterium]|jgi:preprotein translocase subunit SecE|nr:preprotein translocase subunit SecE [Oscillospiraceae bacterium]